MNSNYFQIFAIEPDLKIDAPALRSTLHELARKYHPDFNQENRDNSHSLAEINIAYEVLRDFKKRVAYLLFLYRGKECKMELDAAFLLEMLELNEELEEWQETRDADRRAELLKILQAKIDELRCEYESLFMSFHLQKATEAEVKNLENYLARQQYLERLQNKLNQGDEYV